MSGTDLPNGSVGLADNQRPRERTLQVPSEAARGRGHGDRGPCVQDGSGTSDAPEGCSVTVTAGYACLQKRLEAGHPWDAPCEGVEARDAGDTETTAAPDGPGNAQANLAFDIL